MSNDILIVDDSATIRAMIKRAVGMIGLEVGEVYEAGNGMEALAQMADHPMAAVLADINMPVMNGVQLVKAMRKHETLREIPVIIVSTEGSQQRMERLREVLEPVLGCGNEQNDFAQAADDLF